MPIVPLHLLKSILRVDFAEDDAVLALYVDAAEEFIERHTRRALSTKTKVKHLREFPTTEVTLPYPPFQSITAVTYRDVDGVIQSLPAAYYTLEESGALHRVRFIGDLPDLDPDAPKVSITWTAGYTAGNIPADLQLAVARLAGSYYMNPEASSMLSLSEVPYGIRTVIENRSVPTLDGEGPD
jgi:uncharacterized phiE125 gp8 family phage protein